MEAPLGRAACSDARLLKKSLALLEPQSSAFMAHFFATLCAQPGLRPMFPLTLGKSRKWVFGALTRCAWPFDQPETLARWPGELGRDHRRPPRRGRACGAPARRPPARGAGRYDRPRETGCADG